MADWQTIDIAPLDVDLLIGYWSYDAMANPVWRQKVARAGASNTKPPGMSNGWRDGQATHWMPLPDPPVLQP